MAATGLFSASHTARAGLSVRLPAASIAIASSTTHRPLLELQLDVQASSARYLTVSPSELQPDLVAINATAQSVLAASDAATRCEAHLLMALSRAMLAKTHHDMGNPGLALDLASDSSAHAQASGDVETSAWTLGFTSFLRYWRAEPRPAALAAMEGQRMIDRMPPTSTSLWVRACLARAYAAMGNAFATLDAIRSGEEMIPQIMQGTLSAYSGIFGFSVARFNYYAADALHQLLGLESEATDRALLALADYEDLAPHERSFSDESGARVILSQEVFNGGEFSDGIEWLVPLLSLPSHKRIHGIHLTLDRLRVSLLSKGLNSTERGSLDEFIRSFKDA